MIMKIKKNRSLLLLMLLALCLIIAGCRADSLTIGGVSLGSCTYAHADRYPPCSGRCRLNVDTVSGDLSLMTF